jgi:CubicO group peptidase (beta-lactamase class C family)
MKKIKSISVKFLNVLLLATIIVMSVPSAAQQPISLPRSNPEAEGVSSDSILHFLDAIGNTNNEFHSFMMLRHGKVVAEGWWDPYKPTLKHMMYSVSKSFTATAVGFAVTEKRISVNDKVVSFFPADLPDTVSPYLSSLTIKDLLTMSVGQDPDPTGPIGSNDNWVAGFFRTPILYQPGSRFLYNSAATYMLSAIVQKVTGQRVLDYLQPRLFSPLGISGIDWEVSPQKVNAGGWGLRLKTEDMAKFGQLFLQKGNWNGKQIIPSSWVEEASTKKIDQDPNASQARRDSSDWLQGYCYQMWRSRNNSLQG